MNTSAVMAKVNRRMAFLLSFGKNAKANAPMAGKNVIRLSGKM
jgi:hypothetical protein